MTGVPRSAPDLRVCFIGDSFVAGVGDPQHLGWAGRLAAHSHHRGRALTSYNLGIRRDTTSDVLDRWRTECSPRLPAGCRAGVVVSFGVNDTSMEHGVPRVDPGTSAENLDALLRQGRDAGWPILVAGPPPVDDEEQNERIAVLDAAFATVCARHDVPYVAVLPGLRADEVWRQQVRAGDGAHPGAEGYQVLATLLLPTWRRWLFSLRP